MLSNILLISYKFSPDIGGIETSSEFLAETFVEAGYNVRILTSTASQNETTLKYNVVRNPTFTELLANHKWADVILENNPCVRLGYPRFFIKKNTVTVLHTWLNISNTQKKLIDKLRLYYLKKSTKLVAISKAIQNRCWPSALIISNTYNEKLFSTKSHRRGNDFVFIGRLVSDKGAELAIEAFSHLIFTDFIPEMASSCLTIIGDGEERKKLEIVVASLPDPNRIRFVGSLKGEALVAELTRHAFQFIPSVWEEPFGIVALEGIACGLIPIASDGGGLPDAIGQAGVLFRRGQLDSIISETKTLVQSNHIQAKCLAAAPDHLRRHSQKTIANQYLDLVKDLL